MAASRSRAAAAAALILLGLLLYWPGIRTIPAIDRDEARFAVASRQMAQTGDYVDIRFQNEVRYKKPVGIYWLQSAAVGLVGEHAANPIWPYRLPSLLGMLAAVLATYRSAWDFLDCRQAMFAAALFAASLLAGVEARLATVDACLCAACTLAFDGLHRVWQAERGGAKADLTDCLVFWAAVGCGVLLKGPVLPVLLGTTTLVLSARQRSLRWIFAARPLPGSFVLLAVTLPWFALITLKSGGAFWRESLGHDFVAKLAQGQESHGGFPGQYLLEFPLAFFPGSLLIGRAVRFAWATRRQADTLFLLALIVPNWLLFEAVPTKLPHYVLPLFPAIAIMTARAGLPSTRAWVLCSGATLVLYTAMFGMILPNLRSPFIGRTLVEHRQYYPPDLRSGPVAFAGFHEPSMVLWFGGSTDLASPEQAAAALNNRTAVLAYVKRSDTPAFLKTADAVPIDDVHGFDLAHGKPVELIVYRKAR